MPERPPAYALDAHGGERLRFSDADFLVKASAETTGGAFAIVEEIAPLDTPLHVHGFFRELSDAESAGTIGPEAYARASQKYGVTWIG